MRLTFLIDSLGPGGTERSTALLLPSLLRRGVDLDAVLLRASVTGHEDEVRAAGIPVTIIDAPSTVGRAAALRRHMMRRRSEIVHTALYASDMVGRLACVGVSARVVSSLVNEPLSLRPPAATSRRALLGWQAAVALERATHRAVDHFHAVTPGVKDLYQREYGIAAHRITVVERGRDLAALGSTSPERRHSTRQRVGAADDSVVVLLAGRLDTQKHHTLLLDMVEQQGASAPTVWFAGRDGDQAAHIHARVRSSPLLRSKVELLGHRDDLPELIAAADVVAVPSLYEGTAGVIIEAFAIGTPVVTVDLPGMAGIVEPGRNAVVVARDASSFGDAIGRVHRETGLVGALMRAGRATAQRFDLETNSSRMIDLYRSVLDGPTTRSSTASH